MLEIANRLEIKVEGIDMEEDSNTKSWNGSKLCIFLDSREDARRIMKELPFSLEGAEIKLEAVGFNMEPEAAGQRGTGDAQQQEESEGEWLSFFPCAFRHKQSVTSPFFLDHRSEGHLFSPPQ